MITINKTYENGRLTLSLEGRLDTVTAPQLQEELMPALDEAREIRLIFDRLVYVASAGLRVLLVAQRTANSKNVAMTLCGVSDEIMEVFDMTGFSDMLTIEMGL
jgi:anti-anti-sigma factor